MYDTNRAKMIRDKDGKQACPSNVSSKWYKAAKRIQVHTIREGSKNVLELGCGTGRYFPFIHTENLYGMDGSIEMLEEAKNHWGSKGTYKKLHLIRDSFDSFFERKEYQNKFDYIFSLGTVGNSTFLDDSNNFYEFCKSLPKLCISGGVIEFNIEQIGFNYREELNSILEEMIKNSILSDFSMSEVGEGYITTTDSTWIKMIVK